MLTAVATAFKIPDLRSKILFTLGMLVIFRFFAAVPVPGLKAPLDLVPQWVDVKIEIPKDTDLSRGSVQLDPDRKIVQITRQNDFLSW